jgi:hypothetical protein
MKVLFVEKLLTSFYCRPAAVEMRGIYRAIKNLPRNREVKV